MTARTPSRRHEAPEIQAAAARFIRNLGRRAAEGDTEALEGLLALETVLAETITEAGRAMHDDAGYSWTELANVMGISRQGARQRFTERETFAERQAREMAEEARHYDALVTQA